MSRIKKVEKRVKNLEKALDKIAQQIGTWAYFYGEDDEPEIGDGGHFDGLRDSPVKIVDAVKAIIEHLKIQVGIKAEEKKEKK